MSFSAPVFDKQISNDSIKRWFIDRENNCQNLTNQTIQQDFEFGRMTWLMYGCLTKFSLFLKNELVYKSHQCSLRGWYIENLETSKFTNYSIPKSSSDSYEMRIMAITVPFKHFLWENCSRNKYYLSASQKRKLFRILPSKIRKCTKCTPPPLGHKNKRETWFERIIRTNIYNQAVILSFKTIAVCKENVPVEIWMKCMKLIFQLVTLCF